MKAGEMAESQGVNWRKIAVTLTDPNGVLSVVACLPQLALWTTAIRIAVVSTTQVN
jgi:hypothetical protein